MTGHSVYVHAVPLLAGLGKSLVPPRRSWGSATCQVCRGCGKPARLVARVWKSTCFARWNWQPAVCAREAQRLDETKAENTHGFGDGVRKRAM